MAETCKRPFWHLPNETPSGYSGRCFQIPADTEWRSIIYGALSLLCDEENFVPDNAALEHWQVAAEILELINARDNCSGTPSGEGTLKAKLYYRVASGVSGGTVSTPLAWTNRPINTLDIDSDAIVTLTGSNTFIPIAGSFDIDVQASTYSGDRSLLRVYNVTQATEVCRGDNLISLGMALLSGFFSANGTDEFRVDQWFRATGAGALGLPANQADGEQYLTISLERRGD